MKSFYYEYMYELTISLIEKNTTFAWFNLRKKFKRNVKSLFFDNSYFPFVFHE